MSRFVEGDLFPGAAYPFDDCESVLKNYRVVKSTIFGRIHMDNPTVRTGILNREAINTEKVAREKEQGIGKDERGNIVFINAKVQADAKNAHDAAAARVREKKANETQ
jgi:hypothetical protein